MSGGGKKSVDEIWRELNAAKPKPRAGVAGLTGIGNLPGVTSLVRTVPAAAAASTAVKAPPSQPPPDLAAPGALAATAALGDDAAAYLAALQRTLNCLTDPDRALRRNAATALRTKLLAGDAATPRAAPAVLSELLSGPLLRPLVAMLYDSVERVRAEALALLLQGCAQLPAEALGGMLPELLPAMAARFGALPVQEPAEEVRLQLAQLAGLLLGAGGAPAGALARFGPELGCMLCRGLEDGFPDIKKTACSSLEAAAARLPPECLAAEAERLVSSLAPCLQHPHSRVRVAAVAALDCLVGSGAVSAGLVESAVVGALRPVAHDRAPAVREAAFMALARWMGAAAAASVAAAGGGGSAEGQASGAPAPAAPAVAAAAAALPADAVIPAALPLLLLGVSDPQPGIAALALSLVEGVGAAWAARRAAGAAAPVPAGDSAAAGDAVAAAGGGVADGVDEAALAAAVAACRLDAPYSGRPGAGCRALVRSLLPLHLPPLVRQLGEWTSGLRVAAARGLHTTLVLAEAGAAAHLGLLLPALWGAVADEDVEVAARAVSAVHVLGAHCPPAAWLPRVLDTLAPGASAAAAATGAAAAAAAGAGGGRGATDAAGSGGGGALLASQRTHVLVVLSGLMHAAGRAGRPLPAALLAALAGALAEEGMLAAAAEHGAVRQQLAAAVTNALAWAGPSAADVALPLHLVLLQLYGSELAATAAAAPTQGPPTPPGAAAGPGAAVSAALAPTTAAAQALAALATLAGACGAESIDASPTAGAEALAERHGDWLLAALLGGESQAAAAALVSGAQPGQPAWRPRPGDAAWMSVLRAALLTAPPSTLRRLAAPLVAALRPLVAEAERGAALRQSLLGLVDALLEEPRRGPALAEGAGLALLSDLLMPPLVWTAGKTAAAVRYSALTALSTALRRRLLAAEDLLAALEGPAAAGPDAAAAAAAAAAAGGAKGPGGSGGGGGLLPLLVNCLDEDWYADMRLAGCYVVGQLLQVAGPSLSDASRRALYPELHKRLDDAHNAVRIAACGALAAFVEAAGRPYCDTNSGYLVAGVVIHMDDADPAVQEAACSVLLAAAATKPAVTAAEVRKVRDRFRSKHYCDRVLAACEAAAAAGGVA